MEPYNVSVQIPLSTSKTKCDTLYSKLGIWVTSQVAEWLKTLGNKERLGKSQVWVETAQDPVFLPEIKFWQ